MRDIAAELVTASGRDVEARRSGTRSAFSAAKASPPPVTPERRAEHAARDKRLAEALRENLRRRKEQARARDNDPAPARSGALATQRRRVERRRALSYEASSKSLRGRETADHRRVAFVGRRGAWEP